MTHNSAADGGVHSTGLKCFVKGFKGEADSWIILCNLYNEDSDINRNEI